MKIKGKHIAITAGLSAVLALSPVVGTVSSVYAEGDGSAANARVADEINITMKYLDQNGEWASYTTGTVGGKLQAVDIPMNVPGKQLVRFEVTSGRDQGNTFATVDELLRFPFQSNATVEAVYEDVAPVNPVETHNITVKYLDENGNEATLATTTGADGRIISLPGAPTEVPGKRLVRWDVTEGVLEDKASWFSSEEDMATFVFKGDATVEAVYEDVAPEEPEQRYITVHFMDGDKEISTGAVLNGTSDWSGVTNPTKDGYTFAGWNFEGETTRYLDLDTVVVAYDSSVTEVNLYANWTKDDEVPFERYIDVNYWDGDKLLGTGQVLNGTTQWSGIANPTKDGYTFAGWNFEGETATYTDLSVVRAAYDATIDEINVYANWTENEAPAPEQRYITVNYWDGDQLLGTGAVLNGTSDWSGVVSPTKDGYTFAGWQFEGESTIYTDAELDGVVIAADASVTEINLYAQWDEVVPEDRYITVNYWDGDQLLGTGAVLNGTNQWSGIVNPTKDGYTFVGWQFEGEDTVTSDLDKVVFAGDASVTEINLYAQWNKVVDPETTFYTVTFDDCLANTENLTVEVEEGKTVLKPIDPTCEGWQFVGWFTDTALTQAYDFDAPVTADITLYAKWSQVEGAGETEGAVTPTKPEDKGGLPQTGDIAAIATAAVAVAGAGIAGAGALINKRRK